MAQTKYVTLSKLSIFLDNLANKFSPKSHTHKIDDVLDYTVDDQLSVVSTNPVQNKAVSLELESIINNINDVPQCTYADNGKFLRVVNGSATWCEILSAEEATF